MIPIIYENTETAFTSNGMGRLRDIISCIVTEERNTGLFECEFQYPITGVNYNLIKIGRIIAVTHDDTGDVQPFDIVSYSRPINGVVTFHAVHISYRQSYLTVSGTNINSLSAAFALLSNAQPSNPFTYITDKTSTGYMAAADGIPRTVRSLLGGVEGSILDAYGGEFQFDKFTVKLWNSRGVDRDFSIRYGVNMLEYNEDADASGTFSSIIPYWTDGTTTIIGDKQTGPSVTFANHDECVPLDVSDKFENQPTKAQVEAAGLSYLNGNNTALPTTNIKVSFVRLQDMSEYAGLEALLRCELCDTINVIFPGYNTSGRFKIVKTVWNALTNRFDEMELGELSTTLSEALGITNGLGGGGGSGGGGVLDSYPVGSYYETSDVYFDPNISWGGTWVKDSAGRVTVAQDTGDGSFDVVGETGGSKYIQAHTHSFTNPTITSYFRSSVAYSSGSAARPYTSSGSSSTTDWARASGGAVGAVSGVTTGSGGNLQPYIVVIRWHRIA